MNDLEFNRVVAESVAAIVVCEDGVILGETREADRIFGYIDGELRGKDVHALIPERFIDRHRSHLYDFFQSPSIRPMGANLTLAGLRRDGSEFAIEIALYPTMYAGRRCAVATILNVSHKE